MLSMTVILDDITIPETGVVRIQVDQTAHIQVSAEKARKRVRRWLREDVALLLSAQTPMLTLAERIVWRVPVTLSKTHLGTIGQVGTVDVDVLTGELIDTTEIDKASLIQAAQALSHSLPPYQPRQEIADTYLPDQLPRAPLLQLPNV